jgi:hypothetical protein
VSDPNPQVKRYPCWCSDRVTCHGETPEPFGLCDPCRRLHHRTLPRMGLQPADVELTS